MYLNIANYLPEIMLLLGAVIQTFSKKFSSVITLITIIGATISILATNAYSSDLYIYIFKILICISSGIVYCLSSKGKIKQNIRYFNFIYLFSIIFLMLITSVTDFLSLYVNIELFSICLYFLLSAEKRKISYSETIKYLIFSCCASFGLLIGVSFLYGLTDSINFQNIYTYLITHDNYSFSTYIVPYFFILSGLLFKLGIFPFGNWVIDIYQNIDTKIVTFISIVPKLAIFTALIKVLGILISFETSLILILFALFTSFFGCCYALTTKNLKTIMASSSYINVSYMLIGLSLYTKMSLSAILFYWLTYIFMNIGAFSAILALEHSNLVNRCKDFNGYFYKNPIFAGCFSICIISLIGLPLSGGFIAKIYLITAILNSGIIVLPLLFVIFCIMVVSFIFYIKILQKMFIVLPYKQNYKIKTKSANKIILYACTFSTIFLGLFPCWFIRLFETIINYI